MSDPTTPAVTTESRAGRWLDRLNPFVVKEVRQAMKGKQFHAWFLVLVVLGAIVALIVSGDEDAATGASGFTIFLIYYGGLVFMSFSIVPMLAFQSVSQEIEDGTLELVSITGLRPEQIARGKIFATLVQSALFLSIFLPFMAFSYFLRGIDIASMLVLVIGAVIGTVFLTTFSLWIGSLVTNKRLRVVLGSVLGLVLMGCVIAGISGGVAGMVDGEAARYVQNFFERDVLAGTAAVLFVVLSYCAIFYAAAVGRLSFASANRSTLLRALLVFQWAAWTAAMVWVHHEDGWRDEDIVGGYMFPVAAQWFLVGLFLATEDEGLSRRVARTMPTGVVGRIASGLFFPGGARGLRLTTLVFVATVLVGLWMSDWNMNKVSTAATCAICYGFCYIVIPRTLMSGLRRPPNLMSRRLMIVAFTALASVIPIFFFLLSDSVPHTQRPYLFLSSGPFILADMVDGVMEHDPDLRETIFGIVLFTTALVTVVCGVIAIERARRERRDARLADGEDGP